MGRRKRKDGEDNGFAEWGGYMAAKKAKLQEQFLIDASKEPSNNDSSKIFNGVAIFVNGYSVPSADELKLLMMKHGGIYHHYFRTYQTTHVIATNLPDTKVKQLKNMNIVKPDWIVDSIAAGKLLDYRQYLLYSHQSKTQPKLTFKSVDIPTSSTFSGADAKSKCQDESDGQSFSFDEKSDTKIEAKHQIVTEVNSVPSTSKTTNSIKTASEAGFLSEFYSNSRLHHISTMGATFKQYVNELRAKSNRSFSGRAKLKSLRNLCDTSTNTYSSVIMHIDMDCFFVSVGLRKRPDLKGFPVAVTHSKGEKSGVQRSGVNRKAEIELYKMRREEKVKSLNRPVDNADCKPYSDWVDSIDESNSMSEIASCNYEARKMGLKNGMFMGQALKLCPSLKTIPYDFEEYKEVSYCLYDTVASYTLDVEAVSCDEMFVDCTTLLNETGISPLQFASVLRAEIKEKTGCPCSVGFGSNRLQARLATKRAKPDGQFYLEPDLVEEFMEDIRVSDLPGVGRSTSYKLASMGVNTCSDLRQVPLSKLQAEFGIKSGDSLFKHCRGEDHRKLVFGQVRKSVSAEVNYGIRFQEAKEAENFLKELSKEVHNRLMESDMKTKLITLKLMTRAADAPVETAKFLGHGVCDHVSRSTSLHMSTNDVDVITREVLALSHQLKAEPTELRGIGIQLSKLESANPVKPSGNLLDKFLRPQSEINTAKENSKLVGNPTMKISTSQEASTSTAINKFFTVKKHATDKCKEKSKPQTVKPADIDKEVWEALPEDIRKEVMAEYGLTLTDLDDEKGLKKVDRVTYQSASESSNDGFDLGINFSQIDLEVLDELPEDIKREIESAIPRKIQPESAIQIQPPASKEEKVPLEDEVKLDENLSVREVRSLITAWTSTEDLPQQCDVSMLSGYLRGLVTSHRLDDLDVCISCLHRCIEKRNDWQWQDTYHTMINELQLTMLAEYGKKLRVPSTFRSF